VGKRHESQKNKMEGKGRKKEGMEVHGTSWNPMEGEGGGRMGVMMSH
jgi:hypothetical protein